MTDPTPQVNVTLNATPDVIKPAPSVQTYAPKPPSKIGSMIGAVALTVAAAGGGYALKSSPQMETAPKVEAVVPAPKVEVLAPQPFPITFDRTTQCDNACVKMGYVSGVYGKQACHCFRELQ